MLQGLFFGRIAPPRAERRRIEARTLVVGHGRDPIHPFSDSGMLVSELPDAQLLRARSVFELRLAPGRLMPELARFVDSCWEEGVEGRSRPRLRAAGGER